MRTYQILFCAFMAVFAIVGFGRPALAAPDICKVAAPDTCHVLLDNDQVRVIHFISKAGSKLAMHSHPNHVIYFLTGGTKSRFTMPDGKTQESEGKKGEAVWVPAGDHSTESLSTTDGEVLIIELKGGMAHH